MKIYYKNSGSGSILFKGEGGKWIKINPGVNTVSEADGAAILAKYPKHISTDEEAQKARGSAAAAQQKVADQAAEIAELKAKIAKLELIAAAAVAPVVPAPTASESESEPSVEPKRRGRPAKVQPSESTPAE